MGFDAGCAGIKTLVVWSWAVSEISLLSVLTSEMGDFSNCRLSAWVSWSLESDRWGSDASSATRADDSASQSLNFFTHRTRTIGRTCGKERVLWASWAVLEMSCLISYGVYTWMFEIVLFIHSYLYVRMCVWNVS